MNAFATAFRTTFNSHFIGTFTSDWKTTGVVATMLDGTGTTGLDPTSTSGTNAPPTFPPQVALTLTWKASIFWRGGKPRTYIPGIPTSACANAGSSLLLGSFTSAVQAQAGLFNLGVNGITSFSPNTVTLGFVSYFSRGAFRTPPVFFPFNNVVIHDRLDSQRRRSGKESSYPID
jgi:hypothetical protein